MKEKILSIISLVTIFVPLTMLFVWKPTAANATAIAIGYGVSVFSIAFGVFMTLLELLVAFIQAYVFALLSAIYFGMATEEHGHSEEHSVEH